MKKIELQEKGKEKVYDVKIKKLICSGILKFKKIREEMTKMKVCIKVARSLFFTCFILYINLCDTNELLKLEKIIFYDNYNLV